MRTKWYASVLREIGSSPGIDIGASDNANIALVLFDNLSDDPGEVKYRARLIAAAPDLLTALHELLDEQDVPEPSCSCHISPPCNDCVSYSYIREVIANAIAIIESVEN